ncbi:MAG: CRISPR-associated protein Cas4 [Chloroflexota bacterium]
MDAELELWDPGDLPEVPISAVEHYSYCPRQCALIYVEQTFDDNLYTLRGRLLHSRVHSGGEETTPEGVRVLRGIPLWSERLGLRGKADVVELHPEGPYPVEYKSGRRQGRHPDLQLCAQALCLEEMLGLPVRRGAIFYAGVRRRHEVVFNAELREQTIGGIEAVRRMLRQQELPEAPNDRRCLNCSLIHSCLPGAVSARARLRGFQGALFHVWDSVGDGSSEDRDVAQGVHEEVGTEEDA